MAFFHNCSNVYGSLHNKVTQAKKDFRDALFHNCSNGYGSLHI